MVLMVTDVVDMIIDCLHDHPFSLRSCSLVCHEWIPRSRFHLFSTIELFGAYHSPIDEKDPPQSPRPCDRLYAVIQRSPHIASIIRELHILEGRQVRHEIWVNKTHSLILLLNALTHLEKLHLRRIQWVRLTPELRAAFRGIFTSNLITSLDLELCSFPVKSFISLFSTCSNAKSLILRSMSIFSSAENLKLVEDEEAGNGDDEIPRRKCQLDDLWIVRCPPQITAWINDPENSLDLMHLRTLHCRINQATKTLLYKLGGCLHHVVLMRPSDTDPKKHDIQVVKGILDSNNGLRSLRVTGIDMKYDDNPAARVKEILLSTFSAYHLQSIVMEINVCRQLYTIDWSTWVWIDEFFDGAILPELVKVEFELSSRVYGVYHSHIRDAMTPLFPGLAKRGLLVFS